MAINDPGSRQKKGGTVIQFARRSKQVEDIANAVTAALTPEREAAHCPDEFPITIDPKTAHLLRGYMEQLRIIADELKSVGK